MLWGCFHACFAEELLCMSCLLCLFTCTQHVYTHAHAGWVKSSLFWPSPSASRHHTTAVAAMAAAMVAAVAAMAAVGLTVSWQRGCLRLLLSLIGCCVCCSSSTSSSCTGLSQQQGELLLLCGGPSHNMHNCQTSKLACLDFSCDVSGWGGVLRVSPGCDFTALL